MQSCFVLPCHSNRVLCPHVLTYYQTSSSLTLNTPHHNPSKQRFLPSPDWAAVSLSRPLSIKFAPVEEVERFGKRRKLNDADRQRLSTADGGPIPGLFHSRRTFRQFPSERDVYLSDQIQIRINGQPTDLHPRSNISPEITPSHRSPESIILGQSISHRSTYTHEHTKEKGPWNSLGGLRSSLDDQARTSRAPSTTPETIILQDARFTTLSRITMQDRTVPNTNGQSAKSSWRSRQTLIPPKTTNPILPRHFTLDDPVHTDQRALGSYSGTDRHNVSRSPSLVSTLIAFPLSGTQTRSSQHTSSWWPESRLTDTLIAIHPSHDTDFSDRSESQGVEVFGQFVRLNTDVGISTL